jgi:hypothetical protein
MECGKETVKINIGGGETQHFLGHMPENAVTLFLGKSGKNA